MKRELAFNVPSLNEIEREAIILNAVCHLIDDMLNYGMLVEKWLCCANRLIAEVPLFPDRLIPRPL